MTPLPVEEQPSKTGVRLRIKYNRTTTCMVLNILVISVLLKQAMHCLVAVAFSFCLGHPVLLLIKRETNRLNQRTIGPEIAHLRFGLA